MSQSLTSSEQKAIEYLGQGFGNKEVAYAVGLSESRIAQILSDPEHAKVISGLRLKTLTANTERDRKLDRLEDTLIDKLDKNIGLMYDPMKIGALLAKVNAMRRRGVNSGTGLESTSEHVTLQLPVQIVNHFTVNSNNQVVKVGEQDLVTIQSVNMTRLLEEKVKNVENASNANTRTSS